MAKKKREWQEAELFQIGEIRRRGIEIIDPPVLEKRWGWAIINYLKAGMEFKDIAERCFVKKWREVGPSDGQLWMMREKLMLPEAIVGRCKTIDDASWVISAGVEDEQGKTFDKLRRQIEKCKYAGDLDKVGRLVRLIAGVLPERYWRRLIELGKAKRAEVGA